MIVAFLLGSGVGVAVFWGLRRFSGVVRWAGGVAAGLVLPVAFAAVVVRRGDAAPPGAREVTPREIARRDAETGETRQAAGPELEWPFFPGKGKVAFYTRVHDRVEGKSYYVVYPNMNRGFALDWAVEHSPHFDSVEEVEAFRDETAPDFDLFEGEYRGPGTGRYAEIKASGDPAEGADAPENTGGGFLGQADHVVQEWQKRASPLFCLENGWSDGEWHLPPGGTRGTGP